MSLDAKIIISDSHNPWFNLAAEEFFMDEVSEAAKQGKSLLILFLWQNDHTVVIGRNQNAWTECRAELLEAEGGKLARRSTGGGAVYHDLGNLNFSIITPRSLYDIGRSFGLVVAAAGKGGVAAGMSGRNDVLAEGRKFSGNAFRTKGQAGLHHGTLLVDSDYTRLGRYLNVSKAKLEGKGVKSVKSRVINLAHIKDDLTVDKMMQYMEEAFIEEYRPGGIEYERIDESRSLDHAGLHTMAKRYSSREWRYGESLPLNMLVEEKFDWGNFHLQMSVVKAVIDKVKIYTDALDINFFENLEKALTGREFSLASIKEEVKNTPETEEIINVTGKSVKKDIIKILKNSL